MIDLWDLAKQVLDHLKGFNPFNMLRHTVWYMIALVSVIIILFCLVLVSCQVLKKSICADQVNYITYSLNYRKRGQSSQPLRFSNLFTFIPVCWYWNLSPFFPNQTLFRTSLPCCSRENILHYKEVAWIPQDITWAGAPLAGEGTPK